MSDELTVSIGVPRGAVVLPLDTPAADLVPWAEKAARGLLDPAADEADVTALAGALSGAAADARTRAPVTALSFCPDPAAGELARIEVSTLRPPPEAAELAVRDLARYLAQPTGRSIALADVLFGDLPIGPAVRVRQQYVAASAPAGVPQDGADADRDAADGGADGREPEDGTGTVLQTVAYAARPPGTDRAVLLFVTWQALAHGERLGELADRLAETLRMVPVDTG